MVRLVAPSAGWQVVVDRVVERHRVQDVFLSVKRPDARFHYAQSEVTQLISIPVPSSDSIRVCARTLDALTSGDNAGLEYPIVLTSKPATGTAPKP